MSKRRLNVLPPVEVISKHSSNSDTDDSNSENDHSYQPVSSKRSRISLRTRKAIKQNLPKQENEHTYSCTPLFSNVENEKDKFGACSTDSDDYMDKSCQRRRTSERSTSSETLSYRGKSLTLEEGFNKNSITPRRKPTCFTKNAVMARMNRQRKKEYVENLEGDITNLKESNNKLNVKLKEQQVLISSLRNEIKYLRSVLSNSKEIGMLIRKVCGEKKDLKMTSSLLTSSLESTTSPTQAEEDEEELTWSLPSDENFDTMNVDSLLFSYDNSTSELNEFEPSTSFGVCLHVANKQVSLEFCAACNHNASSVLLNKESM